MKTRFLPAVLLGLSLGVAIPATVADAVQTAPAATVSQLPKTIAEWQKEMFKHAEAVFSDLLKDAQTADEKVELNKDKAAVLAAIRKAASAAARLNEARLAYYEASFSRAEDKKAKMMMSEAPVFAEQIFPIDANMLSMLTLWLPEEAHGEESGACNLRAPAIAQDAGAGRPSDPAPKMAYRAALQVSITEHLLDRVAKSIADSYSANPQDVQMVMDPMGDPCSGIMWEKSGNKITLADQANRKKIGELFAATESAWQAYRKAMLGLICPAHRFYGTAFPLNNSVLDSTLLDGRDQFLGSIARGFTVIEEPEADSDAEEE